MSELPIADRLLLVRRAFLDPHTCDQVRRAMDQGVDEAAEILGDTITTEEQVRRARSIEIERRWLRFLEQQIESVRPDLQRALGRRLGGREGTGLLRYLSGGFYRPHRDRGRVTAWPAAARRAVAVVLFLNSSRACGTGDFDGGVLCVHPSPPDAPVEIIPEAGLLVAFPADALHEVREVRNGIRDAAVDWFYD